jgi:hypothetical protein
MAPDRSQITVLLSRCDIGAPTAKRPACSHTINLMTVLDNLLAVAAFALVVVHELLAVFVARRMEWIHQPHLILPLTLAHSVSFAVGISALLVKNKVIPQNV